MEQIIRTTEQQRIALEIEYDGTCYHGMQYQPDAISVQSELESALAILYGEKVQIVASGRTDSGVHALGQVAHFDAPKEISLLKVVGSLNGITAKSIVVTNAYLVPDDFHARFHAVSREYIYRIYNAPTCSPFSQKRAMWVKKPFDLAFIDEFCSYLVGKHDFKSFCKTVSSDKPTVRIIHEVSVSRNNNIIELKIVGVSFLHNMIRIIVGTLCDFHKYNRPCSSLQEILLQADRTVAGQTAPPYGLYLSKVMYNPDLSTYPSAYK